MIKINYTLKEDFIAVFFPGYFEKRFIDDEPLTKVAEECAALIKKHNFDSCTLYQITNTDGRSPVAEITNE